MHHCLTKALAAVTAAAITLLPAAPAFADQGGTATPIKHVVVIFQENVSFDHYFGTYPHAANLAGETPFAAKEGTPSANTLEAAGLLTNNPNKANPFRIPPSVPVTCDEDHNYNDEQAAFDGGLMDKFVEKLSCNDKVLGPASTMGYYDGNTLTAFWNYAQHFAMSDNSYSTTFGPSTPGALSLISGNTSGATLLPLRPNGTAASPNGNIFDGLTTGAVVGDPRPGFDDCVVTNPKLQTTSMVTVAGKNVGDLLNAKGITWGWFQGGFAPTGVDASGRAVCGSHHAGLAGDDFATTVGDYIPHHEPFEYYAQTTNQHHLRPSSVANIGQSDQANHQYDVTDFFDALKTGHLPAVSYVKAGAYQDGHAGYSDPIDEQIFVVGVINALMQSKDWKDTAVIIAYDDSDGWYDHQMGPIVMQSHGNPTDTRFDDQLLGPGNCGTPKASDVAGGTQNGRCGYGPRQPFVVVSPWAKRNYVDHTVTDLSSILRFIEDNWNLGRIGGGSVDAIAGSLTGMFDFDEHGRQGRTLILDPQTGTVLGSDSE
ncbi:MAG: phospholipase [Candidatus Acidoferrum typicum]|nr:phospholipase [Candidatus Acidoferrum typicum]